MHAGFAGGAFVDPAGRVIGLTTAAEIRGLGVVIPVGIAWKAAADVLTMAVRAAATSGLPARRLA